MLMQGKKGLIMGLANDHSLAWGISEHLSKAGAELAFSYQSPILEKRVRPLGESLGADFFVECDVSSENSIPKTFDEIRRRWGKLDFVVHALAFADKAELQGHYCNTSRSNFMNSMNISCYSFTEIAREAAKLMTDGGSLTTLTYYGAEKVVPHYNVMGVAKAALECSIKYLAMDLGPKNIRVNGISAGPVKTLAASGIGDFRYILKWNQYNSPLRRNTTLKDVGGTALYLISDLSSGVTGEVVHVDSGYHVVGMKATDAPDISAV